jgi:class 3 adenylate cyclase
LTDQIAEYSQQRFDSVLTTLTKASNTASSLASPGAWPFVTLPNFQAWAGDESLSSLTMSVLVSDEERTLWNAYALTKASIWISENLEYNGTTSSSSVFDHTSLLTNYIWKHDGEGGNEDENSDDSSKIREFGPASVYAVSWQSTLPMDPQQVNHNDLDNLFFQNIYDELKEERQTVVSEILVNNRTNRASTLVVQPIFDQVDGQETVAYFKSLVPWDHYFETAAIDTKGIYAVIDSSNCLDQRMTLQLNGPSVTYLGLADLHEASYDAMEVEYAFASTSGCDYQVRLYPSSSTFSNSHDDAIVNAGVEVAIIACAMLVFCLYDFVVRRYQKKLSKTAHKNTALVNSLFPESVRDRLMKRESKATKDNTETPKRRERKRPFLLDDSPSKKTLSTLDTSTGSHPLIPKELLSSKPIADFFPHCTVLFADIVGFTAWSSVRDPTQVFTLLECLYNCFDDIARKRKVFKVETIGDCYVAVTGLPEPMDEHAVVMARFSRQCMVKMLEIVRYLEVHLGPDTGDLSMRFGLHSGPVTAGVMRGEKSRFQLFGDSVNTAARIESTGERAKIHLSQETADLIIEAGKAHWVKARENKVSAKGKGQLQTYWLEVLNEKNIPDTVDMLGESLEGFEESTANQRVGNLVAKFEKSAKLNTMEERTRRQADYTVEVLLRLLKKVVAKRGSSRKNSAVSPEFNKMEMEKGSRAILGEVKEVITFPNGTKASKLQDPDQVVLPPAVDSQLRDFVATIAAMYEDHPFHCFEHANHVTMSVSKLFSRIVTKDNAAERMSMSKQMKKTANSSNLEDINFGITSDPLTEFALVFSALIHDVEHPGYSNAQLAKEDAPLVKKYGKKSVAEQNSVDIAWILLMKPAYKDLRSCIYSTKAELDLFRQLVVNLVIATDIMDKDSFNERNKRWEKSFKTVKTSTKNDGNSCNRKATLVLEHLMQASDVSHYMQHWNVYIKWNRRLFQEVYESYKFGGHGRKDPSSFWYQSELAFFDDVVIPLANKLKECRAFGDDAEEYLNYAKANRRDWQLRGRDVISDYTSEHRGIVKPSSMHSTTSNGSMWSSNSSLNYKPASATWNKPSSMKSLAQAKPPSLFQNQGI